MGVCMVWQHCMTAQAPLTDCDGTPGVQCPHRSTTLPLSLNRSPDASNAFEWAELQQCSRTGYLPQAAQ